MHIEGVVSARVSAKFAAVLFADEGGRVVFQRHANGFVRINIGTMVLMFAAHEFAATANARGTDTADTTPGTR